MFNTARFVCDKCRASTRSTLQSRAFTTSLSRNAIPPESPRYVDVPESFQPELYSPPRPKGVLPVPREIFPPQRPDKPTEEYISNATPAPSVKTLLTRSARKSEHETYKARMSELRRTHLRSGLLELYNRKVVMTQAIAVKSARRQNERARLVSLPPREDERLTAASIPSTMRPENTSTKNSSIADQARTAAVHARRAALTQSKANDRRLSRLEFLHTLYMHARLFITTERQLNAEVDLIFDHPETEWSTAASTGSSVWNLGMPTTVAAMLKERGPDTSGNFNPSWSNGRSITAARTGKPRDFVEKHRLDQERMKKIAEVLSGGTI